MKLLILGGSVFLGRHLVEAALRHGFDVTLFNRGKHNPELFPDVEKLYGDRDGGLAILKDRNWDAVIDTCGYIPRVVRASARQLAGYVGQYIFISTVSVYADPPITNMDEAAPLSQMQDESVEQITGETYGPLKVLCERAVMQEFTGSTLIIRPGLIVGPHDPSDRFTYWPTRLKRGGEILAPGKPERLVQFVDVRDLADWILEMTRVGERGIFNATGPVDRLEFGTFLRVCQEVAGSKAVLTWVDDAFLAGQNVAPYTELPLWLPEDYVAMDMVNCRKAILAGLKFRPLEETIRDTLAWDLARPPGSERRAGLPAEREDLLLASWRERLERKA